MNSKMSVWISVWIASIIALVALVPAPSVAAEEPLPVHIHFEADRAHLQLGECAVLEWHVEGGFVVELNGKRVKHESHREVCPKKPRVYTLAVDTGETVEIREIALLVEGVEPPPQSPAPEKPAGQPQPQIDFRADRTQLNVGECTRLRWDVEHVKQVYLNGKGVYGRGSRQVCPAKTRTHVLHIVLRGGGTTDRQVTIQVAGGGQPAPQPGGKSGADLAVTDLYADKLPQGKVWVRVTNHGPATLNHAQIEMKCTAQGQPLGGQKPWQHTESPWLHAVSLRPGQTATFQTRMTVDTNQYSYHVTCSVRPPSQGAAFVDPNGANDSYSESISASVKTKVLPGGPTPRRSDVAVTDLYPTRMRNGRLFARITNRGPAALHGAKAQLSCQGASFKGGSPTGIGSDTSLTLTLNHGQTAAFDTGIAINIDQYDYYEMTCTVSGDFDDSNPSNNSYSEAIQ